MKSQGMVLWLFLSICVHAQNYAIKKYDASNGLFEIYCRAVVQDKTGFLWIGTSDGLVRFDGYTFHAFYPEPENPNSISTTNIQKVFCDRKGNIWVTEAKLSKYDPVSETFLQIKNPWISEEDVFDDDIAIQSLAEDRAGNIWFRYNSRPFLFYLNAKTKEVSKLSIPQITRHSGEIIVIDDQNRIWFDCNSSNADLKLGCLNIDNYFKTKEVDYKVYSIGDGETNIRSAFINHQHKIIICCNSKTFIFNEIKNEFQVHQEMNGFIAKEYPSSELLNLYEDSWGTVWISTTHGVIYWNPVKKLTGHYPIISNGKICEDRYGVLWIPSRIGLYSINLNQKAFNILQKQKGVPKELNSDVRYIYEDKKEQLWFCTSQGLCKYDQTADRWQIYHEDLKKMSHIHFNSYSSMIEYPDGYFLITGVGLNKLNFEKNIFQYSHPSDTGKSSILGWSSWKVLHAKLHNEYWIASRDGLSRIKKVENGLSAISSQSTPMRERFDQFLRKPKDSSSLIGNFIWTLYEDQKGEIWIGTNAGMSHYNRAQNNFINYKFISSKKGGISSNKVSCFYEDSKNRFWVGTESGLNLMDREKGTFKNYFVTDGLPGNRIWGILEDNQSDLWILTNKNICRFDPGTGIFKKFDESDGLSLNQSNWRAGVCKTKKGIFYISTSGGIVYFNPDSIKDNIIAPDVVITGFKLYNKQAQIGQVINGDVILTRSITKTKSITLSHKNKVISIDFVGLHYIDPHKMKYAFRLDNFDSSGYWNQVSSDRRFANYTNLKAGSYIFRVKACNNDGHWNEKGEAVLFLTILPAWWETMWFRVLMILLLISSTGVLFVGRIYQVQHQKKVLRKMVDEKTEEIRLKSEVLKEVNTLLMEQQQELQQTNVLLEERQEEIISQNEEIEYKANELRKANATKDKFFSIIGHDLKNPMFAISSLSQILDENGMNMDAVEVKDIYKMLVESSKSVTVLLENLLTWARAQAGKMKPEATTFDLKEIMDSTTQVIKLNIENKGLHIISEIKSGTMVYADKNMITTIIRNLINNAIKFTAHGSITVKAEVWQGLHKISITDTGIGMTDDVKEKLFSVDSHFSTQGTSGESGTGLGLIICKEFVELNNGKIWVESEPGKGSSFIFTLPELS